MKQKIFYLLSAVAFMGLVSCKGGETPSSSQEQEVSSEIQGSSTESSSSQFGNGYTLTTIAKALEIAKDATEATKDRYYILGTIKTITDYTYGTMTIEDATGSIFVYGTYSADGVKRYGELEKKPVVGDKVILYANLANYNGTLEIKSGWIVEMEHIEHEVSIEDYAAMDIAQARKAKKGDKVKVTGRVARFTYASGLKKNGFYLIDSASSIYVFDSALASQVEEGNEICLAAEKDYWILEKEQNYAKKYNYEGACQLTKGILVSNKKITDPLNFSFAKETTIKEFVNIPVTNNISGEVFKVNSYIKRQQKEGQNFVNYYFYDIDEKTGSYAYTQCNGSDFSWLDKFDGKICTVYLSAINAKSTASGCFWRFVPLSVKDENYQFNTANVGQFVYDYHIDGSFDSVYAGDPIKSMPKSISSTLLGFENATITYASSNTEVAFFEEKENEFVFHTKDDGEAKITVEIHYQDNPVYKKEVSVKMNAAAVKNAKTVKEAINATKEEIVTVKGIAGPSVVNQNSSFYLIDESGIIPVTLPQDDMNQIEMGNEIVVTGKRDIKGGGELKDKKTGEVIANVWGENFISNASLTFNLYGKTDYSKNSFVKDKTLADLDAMSQDSSKDLSSQGYTVSATFKKVEDTNNRSTWHIQTNDADLELYASDVSQYDWLTPYVGKTVSVDLALCNWNKKSFYKAAILSVTDGNKTVYNTYSYTK